MNAKLKNTVTPLHDPDDAPELTDEFFQRADTVAWRETSRC